MTLHKLWAHLGTLLAGIAAGLTDFNAVATSPNVKVMLTAVAGALVALHIPYAATFERDFQAGLKSIVAAYKAANLPSVPTGPTQAPPAPVSVTRIPVAPPPGNPAPIPPGNVPG